MTSRWENIPLDVIREEFRYLDEVKDIKKFCEDPYIYEKLCKDENGEMWQYLFNRDFSDEIKVRKGSSIMKKYLAEKQKISYLERSDPEPEYIKLWYAIDKGYENLLHHIDYTKISPIKIKDELISAIQRGQYLIATFLLNLKLDSAFDFEQMLHQAIHFDQLQIVSYIVENFPGLNLGEALRIATIYDNIPILEYLLGKGADIHYNRDAAIRMATQRNKLNVVKFLLQNGADYNAFIRAGTYLRGGISDFVKKNRTSLRKLIEQEPETQIEPSSEESTPKSTVTSTSTKCIGTTKTGKQCCRKAENGSQYCFQHK